jgi:hypothetical protein
VTLSPAGAGTKLTYIANAQVGGKLAQVGSRLIDGVAKKMADEFFQRFNEKLVGPAPVAREEAVMAAAPAGPWLAGTYAFAIAAILVFLVIWLLR